MSDTVSKSWFAVFNNPQQHGYDGEPSEVIDRLISEWISNNPTRSCAMTFCVSADGLPHVHMVLEDVKAMRFSTIKKTFAVGAHFEATKGSKEQAEDYINKRVKKSCILIGMVKSKVAKEKDVIWKLLVNLLSKVIILIKLWI